ncbi:CD8A protein, partial [Rhinopomastus cyanomelas]|nr:CD8A protein [Rhinopomastus cyanomelas]
MDGSPVPLLLLSLGLCCTRIHGHRSEVYPTLHSSSTRPLQVGQRLELECKSPIEDSGVFWIHQDKGGNLQFIVFISHLSQPKFVGNVKTSARFEVKKHGRLYSLVVKSFKQQDEGNYVCLILRDRALYFSRHLPVFFP